MTGLRRKGLLNIGWGDINLSADNAFVRVRASLAKNSQHVNTAALLRADMGAAGIEAIDKDGNAMCFHSLRNSYISFLANSQTPAKIVMALARHSDPRLAFNIYARTFDEAEQKAVAFLPNFGDFVLSTSLDKVCRKQEICIDSRRHQNGGNALETTFPPPYTIPPRGVEPLSPG